MARCYRPINGYLKLGYYLYLNPNKYAGAYNFGPSPSQIISVEELIKN